MMGSVFSDLLRRHRRRVELRRRRRCRTRRRRGRRNGCRNFAGRRQRAAPYRSLFSLASILGPLCNLRIGQFVIWAIWRFKN